LTTQIAKRWQRQKIWDYVIEKQLNEYGAALAGIEVLM